MGLIMLLAAVWANYFGVVLLHFVEKLGESAATVAAKRVGAAATCVFLIFLGHG
jgi:hypothetical protein